MATKYDLVIIGAGPAGYVGGIRAGQLGLKTAVVEKAKVGGVCLNKGCIPSKALIHQAELLSSARKLESVGISLDTSGFDYKKVYKKSRKAATTLSKGVQYLLKKNNVELISGTAKITSPHEVSVETSQKTVTLAADTILLATGSSPKELPGISFNGETILSSDQAIMLQELPKSLLVLGGGAIGCEFSHIMHAFGVDVHLVEMLDHLLPPEERESAEVLERDFKKRGIRVYTKTRAMEIQKTPDGQKTRLKGPDGEETVVTEKVLLVVGRKPNTDEIGLDEVGVSREKGFVTVGDYYRTNVPSIYAVGDIVQSKMFAHVASKEAEIAVEHIAGENPPKQIDPLAVPSAVYTKPQVASFGMTQKQAEEEDIPLTTYAFPYQGAGKAAAIEQKEGQVKVVSHKETGEILGAHIVGADATEVIHEILLAKSSELLPPDISKMIHAHPTISEAVMEALRGIEGWAIHV